MQYSMKCMYLKNLVFDIKTRSSKSMNRIEYTTTKNVCAHNFNHSSYGTFRNKLY